MKTAYLFRTERSDHGMFGHFCCEDFHVHTGERPWRNNQPDISCIPISDPREQPFYLVVWEPVGKHKGYVIKDVPGRTDIEIHIANFFGDTEKGLKSNVLGCIGPGLRRGKMKPRGKAFKIKQEAVISSGKALKKLNKFFNQETFRLVIEDKFNIGA